METVVHAFVFWQATRRSSRVVNSSSTNQESQQVRGLILLDLFSVQIVRMAQVCQALPALFLSHGGGPAFLMNVPRNSMFAGIAAGSAPHKWYKNLAKQFKIAQSEEELIEHPDYRLPKAIVVITAHWETRNVVGISDDKQHKLYYDYFGFPEGRN